MRRNRCREREGGRKRVYQLRRGSQPGGSFAFGGATFFGSAGDLTLKAPIVACLPGGRRFAMPAVRATVLLPTTSTARRAQRNEV